MPWRESTVMEERLRFVARRLEGELMTALCREFDISRKTGHKLLARWKAHGLEALADRSRKPGRVANRLPMPVEARIVALRREHPNWGARKLRELLGRRLGDGVAVPARSTIHAVLDRHGLVEHARARRPRATGTALSEPSVPNDLWRVDFKGEFRLGNGKLCYPLTVTDQVSALPADGRGAGGDGGSSCLHGVSSPVRGARPAARHPVGQRRPFRQPAVLRPLAALGLVAAARHPARAHQAGRPQQNGRHERMHLTLKQETIRPAAANSLAQQARFDDFVETFNAERPHEALAMRTPAEVHTASPRPFPGLPELAYPFHDRDVIVARNGTIGLHGRQVIISTVFEGQRLGLREVDTDVWLVSFMHYDLGYIDLEARTLQTIDTPFGSRASPM